MAADETQSGGRRPPPTRENRLAALGWLCRTFWEGAAVLYPEDKGGGSYDTRLPVI